MATNDSASAKSSPVAGSQHEEPGPLSPDVVRTLIFVGSALGCLIITLIITLTTAPPAIQDFGKTGQEYYAEFTDPTLATSLEVYAFDAEDSRPLQFRVEQLPNGRWVIPSHHNYPADAAEQLAKSASSLIGVKRGALMSRWPTDHNKYGVVNPNQERLDVSEVEGLGQRIILRGEKEEVLADLIIGKKVDDQENRYYVRQPDEDEVYITDLEVDLSTKFTDWIETDLLEVDAFDVRQVTINNYNVTELGITPNEVSNLTRDSSSDPWKLEGLNEEAEELDKDAIRDTVDAIAGLEIAGVRPKLKGLTPNLEIDAAAINNSRTEFERLQFELLARGFSLQQKQNEEELSLIASEGELHTSTEDGLVYRLYFGRAFAGSDEEIEIGSSDEGGDDKESAEKEGSESDEESSDGAGSSDESAGDGESEDAKGDDENKNSEEAKDDGKPGRYVFVRVNFDQSKLGEEPMKPVEPQEPAANPEPKEGEESEATESSEGAKEGARESEGDDSGEAAKNAEGDAEATDGDGENAADDSGDDNKENETDKEGDEEKAAEEDPAEKARKEYEEAKRQYEFDLRTYERELEEYKEKIEEGQKRAEELNRRFAEWYYVIPGDSYEKLSLSRADLVKEKEKEEEDKDATESRDGESEDGNGSENGADSKDGETEPENDAESKDGQTEPEKAAGSNEGEGEEEKDSKESAESSDTTDSE